MKSKQAYHHGDLAAALIIAAQDELTERGIESFSLRGVAKRAGVSHAAPAHHFGDVEGLLTALAAHGFRRFVQRQQDFRRRAEPDAASQLIASGVGYVTFAQENPALFRLMFSSSRTHFDDPQLGQAAGAAYQDLVRHVAQACGAAQGLPAQCGWPDPNEGDPALQRDVAATWALAHGLADLLVAGRLPSIGDLPVKARREAIAEVLRRRV